MLNTQTALFQAQDALAQAQLERLKAVVALFQALGGGWQMPQDDRPKVGELPKTPQEISFPVQDLPRFQGHWPR